MQRTRVSVGLSHLSAARTKLGLAVNVACGKINLACPAPKSRSPHGQEDLCHGGCLWGNAGLAIQSGLPNVTSILVLPDFLLTDEGSRATTRGRTRAVLWTRPPYGFQRPVEEAKF